MELNTTISWYVARTNPRAEERSAAGLMARGFHVHLPRGVKQVRRRNMRTKQPVLFPLLTGYLFVGLSPSTPWFYDLRQVDGIHSILGRQTDDETAPHRSRYIPVAAGIIEEFKRLEGAGAFSEPEEGARLFEPGDIVTVRDGALAGMQFVFDDYFGKHAGRVIGSLFGALHPIQIPLANLRKAA